MENCFKPMHSCTCAQLVIIINTRHLTINILDNKRKDLVKILLTTWSSSRKSITLRDIASILGLVSNLNLTKQWVKCTCIFPHHAVSLVLKFNLKISFASGKFKHLTDLLTSNNINIKNFCLLKAHKTVWNSKEKFNVTKSMRVEINLLISM